MFAFGAIYGITRQNTSVHEIGKPLQLADTSGAYSLQNAFVQVAKMVKPAVVMITTEKTVTYRYWNPFEDDFFDRFFEDFGVPRFRQQQPKTYKKKQEGLGSGFIVDEDGYILTNNHVIQGVDKILVKLMDSEKKYEAKVIGTTPEQTWRSLRLMLEEGYQQLYLEIPIQLKQANGQLLLEIQWVLKKHSLSVL